MTGDLEESRAQLEIAMKMSPRFQTIVALKLGRQLASLHRYYEAYPYLDIAGKMTLDPNSADKIRAFRNRVALVRYNSPRDIALKIKTLISSEKPRS